MATKPATSKQTIALFDLDYTLISSDCTAHWLKHLIYRSRRRKLLVLSLMPLIRLMTVLKLNLATRNSVYLWAATVGLSRQGYLLLRRHAAQHITQIKGVKAYPRGLERLQWHRQQGHKVVVVTGALRWLARDICRELGIEYDTLLGSSERSKWGGRVSDVFCYQHDKVTLLKAHGVIDDKQTRYGYSDSSADIPMLDLCEHIVLVNPKPSCRDKFNEALSQTPQIVTWKIDDDK